MSKTPSIAVIPSGYKASKVYSVLPTNGDADLDFTRDCVATRVNQNGLLEEVGLNVPRLDYSDGGCPSLLLEPNRTNLVIESANFSAWSNYGSETSIVLDSSKLNIDGNLGVYKVTSLSGQGRTGFTQSVTPNTQYTLSFYVESVNVSDVDILINNSDIAGTIYNYTSELINNQFVRVVITFNTLLETTSSIQFTRNLAIGESLYFSSIQLEEGSYATSYIPTSGTEVTRFKDEASKDNLESYINSSEGVLYFEMSAFINTNPNRAITFSDGTPDNRIMIYYRYIENTLGILYEVNNEPPVVSSAVLSNITDFKKFALVYNSTNFRLFLDGSEFITINSSPNFNTNTLNRLSFDSGSGTSKFEGKIKDLRVYNEALTDAELITLTQ